MMDPDTDPTGDAAHVRAAALALADAIVAGDADRIGGLLEPHWRLIDADGVTSRERLLHLVRTGELTHSEMRPLGDLEVRVLGDVAIVFGRVVNTAHVGGRVYPADEWTTDIFQRGHSGWRCVHSHVTPVGAQR